MLADIFKLVRLRYCGMKYETTRDSDYLYESHDSDQATCDLIACGIANLILIVYFLNYHYYNAFGFVVHYTTMYALIKMLSKVLFSPRTLYQLVIYAITDIIIIIASLIPLLVISLWISI